MEAHLQRFLFHPVDRDLCRLWADVRHAARRAGHAIGAADAWIAATVLACAAPLLTHNAADFRVVSGLTVISERAP